MGLLPSLFTVQVASNPMPYLLFQALREIEIETAIGRASIFRLHFDLSRTMKGDFDALAIDVFRPLYPVTISIAGGVPLPQVLINGYIKDVSLKAGNEPGTSRLEVVGMDSLGTIMANQQLPATWPNLSESEIAAAIFKKYAKGQIIDPMPRTRTVNDTTTAQLKYDGAYLMQLARCNNFELYIQPDPFTGRDVGHLHRPRKDAPSQGVLSIDFGKQSNLTQFHVANDMLRPTGVQSAAVDQSDRSTVSPYASKSTELPMGAEPSLSRILPPPIARQIAGCAANPAEARRYADAQASATSRAISATGEVDGIQYGRPLRAGLPVLVRGAGRQNSGLYYVSVRHACDFARRLPAKLLGLAQCRRTDRRGRFHRSFGAGRLREETHATAII